MSENPSELRFPKAGHPGEYVVLPEPARIDRIPRHRVAALFDLDGTLTEPGSELLIETFLREVAIGSTHVREQLEERFENWHEARRKGNPDYEQYLKDIGLLWAKMLYKDDSGKRISRRDVVGVAKEWYDTIGNKDLQPYALDVMEIMRENKFEPVLVTGAPYEIAAWYAADLGINHIFAMDAEQDAAGQYTTKMRFPANRGMGANKSAVCIDLKRGMIPVGFAMGDTLSDIVLWDSAINRKHDRDIEGGAFLINWGSTVLSKVRETRKHDLLTTRLRTIEQGTLRESIAEGTRDLVASILRNNNMQDGEDLRKSEKA